MTLDICRILPPFSFKPTWDCNDMAVVTKQPNSRCMVSGAWSKHHQGLLQRHNREPPEKELHSLDHRVMRRVVDTARNTTGCKLPSLEDLCTECSLNKSLRITEDPTHPRKGLSSPLNLKRATGYKMLLARTSRLRKSLFSQAIRLINDSNTLCAVTLCTLNFVFRFI